MTDCELSPALSLNEALALRLQYPKQSAWFLGGLADALHAADRLIQTAADQAAQRFMDARKDGSSPLTPSTEPPHDQG